MWISGSDATMMAVTAADGLNGNSPARPPGGLYPTFGVRARMRHEACASRTRRRKMRAPAETAATFAQPSSGGGGYICKPQSWTRPARLRQESPPGCTSGENRSVGWKQSERFPCGRTHRKRNALSGRTQIELLIPGTPRFAPTCAESEYSMKQRSFRDAFHRRQPHARVEMRSKSRPGRNRRATPPHRRKKHIGRADNSPCLRMRPSLSKGYQPHRGKSRSGKSALPQKALHRCSFTGNSR